MRDTFWHLCVTGSVGTVMAVMPAMVAIPRDQVATVRIEKAHYSHRGTRGLSTDIRVVCHTRLETWRHM